MATVASATASAAGESGAFVFRDYRVVFGRGSVAELGDEIERLGAARPVVVTGKTLSQSDVLDDVAAALGDRDIAIFTGAGRHGLVSAVDALAELMREHRADALVSLGGGSAVDVAKGATMVSTGQPLTSFRRRSRAGSGARPMDAYYSADSLPCAPIVAIPTTLSGAEFTGQAGLTLEGDGGATRKDQYYHRGSAPRAIFLDPAVTRRTPEQLWRSSGIKCLDHNVERLYSRHGHPFSEALQTSSAQILLETLGSEEDHPDSAERTSLLIASWMAQFSTGNVNVGLSHAIGHQLGAFGGVSHGDTSAVMLPPVMEFNASAAAGPLARLAKQVGELDADGNGDVAALINRIRSLIERLGLPTRLRDTKLQKELIPIIAERSLTDTGITGNPRQVTSSEEILALLEAAW